MYSLVNHFTQPLLCCSVRAASDPFHAVQLGKNDTNTKWYLLLH